MRKPADPPIFAIELKLLTLVVLPDPECGGALLETIAELGEGQEQGMPYCAGHTTQHVSPDELRGLGLMLLRAARACKEQHSL
jgi:hypothetical protein